MTFHRAHDMLGHEVSGFNFNERFDDGIVAHFAYRAREV